MGFKYYCQLEKIRWFGKSDSTKNGMLITKHAAKTKL